MAEILYKELSYKIQGAFYSVRKALGNVHKENVYHSALIEEFERIGLKVENQKQIGVYYRDKKVGVYVPDLVIEDSVIIELKCKPVLADNDVDQFWHYLKGSEYRLGYLVNFGSDKGIQVIRRVYDTARALSR